MRPTLVVAPVGEPLVVPETKIHLRVEHDDEDDLIEALIPAARGLAERRTDRQFLTATWKLALDGFPCTGGWSSSWAPIQLRPAPLLTVVSVKYQDENDAQQTWDAANYVVDAPQGPYAPYGRIYPKVGQSYPATASRPDAVVVEFTAGYGPFIEDVPAEIRQALLLIVGHWYMTRETVNIGNIVNEIPFAADALLAPFSQLAALIR